MQSSTPSLFSRDDTFLGVCEALGEDLGFNPLWLRLGFALGVFWNPMAVIVGYLVVGVAVLASRRIFPSRPAVVEVRPAERPQAIEGVNDGELAPTAIAA